MKTYTHRSEKLREDRQFFRTRYVPTCAALTLLAWVPLVALIWALLPREMFSLLVAISFVVAMVMFVCLVAYGWFLLLSQAHWSLSAYARSETDR